MIGIFQLSQASDMSSKSLGNAEGLAPSSAVPMRAPQLFQSDAEHECSIVILVGF